LAATGVGPKLGGPFSRQVAQLLVPALTARR
jgi:hypothetical protein